VGLLRRFGDLQTSLCAGHHVSKDQPTFSGRAESFLMARLEFGLSNFLFGSLPAFCGSEHYAFLGDPTFSKAAKGMSVQNGTSARKSSSVQWEDERLG
jgi:hypothetical protein